MWLKGTKIISIITSHKNDYNYHKPIKQPLKWKWPSGTLYIVEFSPLTDWAVGGTRGTIHKRSFSSLLCRRPLCAILAWAGMSTLWCCQSCITSADHGVAHSPRCPEGWFWRDCRGVQWDKVAYMRCKKKQTKHSKNICAWIAGETQCFKGWLWECKGVKPTAAIGAAESQKHARARASRAKYAAV